MSETPIPKPFSAASMPPTTSSAAAPTPLPASAAGQALRVRLMLCAAVVAAMAAIAVMGSIALLAPHLELAAWALSAGVGLLAGLTLLALGRRLLVTPMQRTLTLVQLAAQPHADADALQAAAEGVDPATLAAVETLCRQIAACQQLLRESDQRLEQAVLARTHTLSAARDQADAGNRAKSRFLATMSHEIRTPLNGVLGITELMLAGELAPQQRRYAEIVRQSGTTLLHTLNDVLDLAKVEAGKLEIEQVAFRPDDVLEECLQLFAQAVRTKGLKLAWALDRSLSQQMVGDPHRLKQMVSNLLSNAIKFTAKGEIELRAAVHEREPEPGAPLHDVHRNLVFSVKDTGIGIDPAHHKAVFDPFFQADGANARRYGGTGLGLSIVQQLAHLMGGRVELQSTPGQGSRFTVVLPAPQPLSPDAQTRPAALGGLTARLLLHDKALRGYLADQIESLGMLVAEGSRADQPVDMQFIDEKVLAQWRRGDALQQPETHLGTVLVVADASRHTQKPAEVAAVLQAPWRQLDLWQKLIALAEAPLAAAEAAEAEKALEAAKAAKVAPEATANAAAIDAPASRPQAGPALSGRTAAGSAPRVKAEVLLVEDNPVNAEVACTIFQMAGAQVQWVENGADAVALVQNRPFSAIFMDLQMPVMDGFEATRLIRAMESAGDLQVPAGGRPWTRLPIIALTANALSGDRERCLAAGFDEHIAKPISMDEAAAALQRWAGTAPR